MIELKDIITFNVGNKVIFKSDRGVYCGIAIMISLRGINVITSEGEKKFTNRFVKWYNIVKVSEGDKECFHLLEEFYHQKKK